MARPRSAWSVDSSTNRSSAVTALVVSPMARRASYRRLHTRSSRLSTSRMVLVASAAASS